MCASYCLPQSKPRWQGEGGRSFPQGGREDACKGKLGQALPPSLPWLVQQTLEPLKLVSLFGNRQRLERGGTCCPTQLGPLVFPWPRCPQPALPPPQERAFSPGGGWHEGGGVLDKGRRRAQLALRAPFLWAALANDFYLNSSSSSSKKFLLKI